MQITSNKKKKKKININNETEPFSSSFMISCDFSKSVRLNLYRRLNLLSASSGYSSADAAALLLLLLL